MHQYFRAVLYSVFNVKRTLGTKSYEIWNKLKHVVLCKSVPKSAIYDSN